MVWVAASVYFSTGHPRGERVIKCAAWINTRPGVTTCWDTAPVSVSTSHWAEQGTMSSFDELELAELREAFNEFDKVNL